MSSLGINPDIDLEQLLRVAASSEYSVQFAPMLRGPGGRQGGTVIRRAVSWKGITGSADDDAFWERLEAANADVADGLREAQSMVASESDKHKGVVLLRKNGEVYPVSKMAAVLAEKGKGDGQRVEGHEYQNLNDAIAGMTALTGRRPAMPTVY